MSELLTTAESARLAVIEGIEFQGQINTSDAVLAEHVAHSIRLGYPQIRPQAAQKDRVCLVGGGPSLETTFEDLRALYFAGAKVVTVNGAYAWCLERNIRPSAQIVLDARKANARFVDPPIPQCRYLLASQCHPELWARVEGRPDVWIWHAAAEDNQILRPILDAYYLGNWVPTPGGTTVVMRAITVLRMLGFLRFDLFGVDSCVLDGKSHAYPQPENDGDRVVPFRVHPKGHPELGRVFSCTSWQAKQLECFLQLVRLHGHTFLLQVHGDGLLAYALQCAAQVEWSEAAATDGERSREE